MSSARTSRVSKTNAAAGKTTVGKPVAGREPSAPPKPPAGAATVDAAAPRFALLADDGSQVTLEQFRGQWVVLFFYPKDNTPGCTREAVAFQAASAQMKKLGAVVLGISRDSVTSHVGFKRKQGLQFPLLSDPAADTHKLYGAFGQKVMYGKKVLGAIRTTALIRPDGTLAKIYSPVKVDGHADAVLDELEREKR